MATSPLDSAIQSQRSEKKSKRGILYTALLGVAGLGAASSVFAASISINSGAIEFSQGSQTIAACDADQSITAVFDSVYDGSSFNWSSLTLEGVDDACDGGAATIEIWGGSPAAKLVTVSGTLDITAGSNDNDVRISNNSGIVTDDGSTDTNTWTLFVSNTPTVTYESSQTAATVASNGATLAIEIN
ncbi:hypothetical protein N9H87_01685 [Pontimonas sp.]|nr:hypothetical protein [Pontimonas sp.]MDA8862919.1 hypothetical protein [Pontimonas sp.]